ncbi:hypothetical protein [Halobaculum sp. EA56]|uniref:hypothetical protein n=1 Tax=Halobaculum sp. EA56 TaxID=3421648 RepID=UPI003EBA3574
MSSRADRTDDLREVFESVTGTNRIVEPQDEEAAGAADGDADDVVDGVDLDSVRNDGISDVSDDTEYAP